MAYELKGVWSTVGTPTFESKKKFELAKTLAGIEPYSMWWNYLEQYRFCYGDKAVDALEESRTDGCNGFLVVSNRKDWASPGAVQIQPDPIPEPAPGLGEVKVQTPWGSLNQKEAGYIQAALTAGMYLSRESLQKVIKQLNLMLEQ